MPQPTTECCGCLKIRRGMVILTVISIVGGIFGLLGVMMDGRSGWGYGGTNSAPVVAFSVIVSLGELAFGIVGYMGVDRFELKKSTMFYYWSIVHYFLTIILSVLIIEAPCDDIEDEDEKELCEAKSSRFVALAFGLVFSLYFIYIVWSWRQLLLDGMNAQNYFERVYGHPMAAPRAVIVQTADGGHAVVQPMYVAPGQGGPYAQPGVQYVTTPSGQQVVTSQSPVMTNVAPQPVQPVQPAAGQAIAMPSGSVMYASAVDPGDPPVKPGSNNDTRL